MEGLVALLRFLAPSLADVPDSEVLQALGLSPVPGCLVGKAADKARVYYAIYLLTDRARQTANADVGSLGGVKQWREGDVSVTFTDAASGENGVYDPSGFYAKWRALAKLCGAGAITVSPSRRGCGC